MLLIMVRVADTEKEKVRGSFMREIEPGTVSRVERNTQVSFTFGEGEGFLRMGVLVSKVAWRLRILGVASNRRQVSPTVGCPDAGLVSRDRCVCRRSAWGACFEQFGTCTMGCLNRNSDTLQALMASTHRPTSAPPQ